MIMTRHRSLLRLAVAVLEATLLLVFVSSCKTAGAKNAQEEDGGTELGELTCTAVYDGYIGRCRVTVWSKQCAKFFFDDACACTCNAGDGVEPAQTLTPQGSSGAE